VANPLRVRTITTGIELDATLNPARLESALGFLTRARERFVGAGYEVQTLRVSTNPWADALDASARSALLPRLRELDAMALAAGAIVSIGPVLAQDRLQTDLPAWIDELVRSTKGINCSVVIASDAGVHARGASVAAEAIVRLAASLPDGVGNFRFAAAANIPPGTPFFPVAWHRGTEAFAVGLEGASVVEEAFATARNPHDATQKLRARLDEVLQPVDDIANELARSEKRAYLGIDTSPAPAKDRSIAAALEALLRQPFGSTGSLEACSAVTAALKSVKVPTCGYSGLMLPVLEDPLLAQRAGEHRFGVRDLLLYSAVCGTGLDVVPLPGNTSSDRIARLLRDVAALSAKLRKPLSARLFLVPGKKAGDIAKFNDPLLTDSMVMKLD
jgi:uncharacterized protein (UPF0210 family)